MVEHSISYRVFRNKNTFYFNCMQRTFYFRLVCIFCHISLHRTCTQAFHEILYYVTYSDVGGLKLVGDEPSRLCCQSLKTTQRPKGKASGDWGMGPNKSSFRLEHLYFHPQLHGDVIQLALQESWQQAMSFSFAQKTRSRPWLL